MERDYAMSANRWDDEAYLRLVSAEYNPRTKDIAVSFGNGDALTIAVTRLVRRDPFVLDWARLTIEESSYLHIPPLPEAHREAADIPAFDMRALTDAEFASHLA